MASRPVSAAGVRGSSEKSYFEQQREELIGEIAMSFEHVLANINKLNRSLEAVIAVGNEFSSVEALWSTFENVMAKEPEPEPSAEEGTTPSGEGEGSENHKRIGSGGSQHAEEEEEEEGEEDEETQIRDEDGEDDTTIQR